MPREGPRRGFSHHHTLEELRAYGRLSAEEKMRWLHEAWMFTSDFLAPDRLEAYRKLRKGEL